MYCIGSHEGHDAITIAAVAITTTFNTTVAAWEERQPVMDAVARLGGEIATCWTARWVRDDSRVYGVRQLVGIRELGQVINITNQPTYDLLFSGSVL